MPQTSYPLVQDAASAGMIVDSGFNRKKSYSLIDAALDFGLGVVRSKANPETQCRKPYITQQVILDDAGTYTAGDILVTVAGTLITESFDTDKATTMAALAASIQALADIATAVYAGGGNTITIVGATDSDADITVVVDVSGITGTMTITSITPTSNDVPRGIALATAMANRSLPVLNASTYTPAAYVATDMVNTMTQGIAVVVTADAVVENADVYLIISGADRGKFTDDNSSPNIQVPSAKFRSAVAAAGIAQVEINVP